MDIKKLENLIKNSETGLDVNYIKSLMLPSVEIIETKADIKTGCSKLGGIPDVPPDFALPTHEYGAYRFIAQFNLSEVSQALLPAKCKRIIEHFCG